MKTETLEDIAQWVIEFRFPKNEDAKVSDFEMYHTIIDKCSKWQKERSYSEEDMREAYKYGKIYDMTSFEEWFEQFKNK